MKHTSASRSHGICGISALLLTLLFVATGCGGGGAEEGQLTGRIQIDGSSTVYPIVEGIAEEFMREHPRVRVTVGVSGTGGGFSKFARGETDISNASRPIMPSEANLAEENGIQYIELPVAYDGIAVMVHPSNDFVDCLTVDELQQIWEPGSDIDRWNQIRSDFPDRPITLYGPGTDSGTYDYFTEAIGGEAGASRSDFTASEDDNVLVQGIAGDRNALGFFGLSYYENNSDRLKLLGIDDEDPENGEGCVQPTPESVQEGTYQPLTRPEFIYVRADRAGDPEVDAFVEFFIENADQIVREVEYVPLAPDVYEMAWRRYDQRITGSLFDEDGAQIGTSMAELLEQANDELPDTEPEPVRDDTTAAGE